MNGTERSHSTTSRIKCPACGTQIRETEQLPRPDVVYRCPVCRLDFVLDPDTLTLTLAPLPSSKADTPKQSGPRDVRHTAAASEGGATPANLIRERVPLVVDHAADQSPRPAGPAQAATAAPQHRKRRRRT
jgi:hypothetical protein